MLAEKREHDWNQGFKKTLGVRQAHLDLAGESRIALVTPPGRARIAPACETEPSRLLVEILADSVPSGTQSTHPLAHIIHA